MASDLFWALVVDGLPGEGLRSFQLPQLTREVVRWGVFVMPSDLRELLESAPPELV
jgi:hypothetical protein